MKRLNIIILIVGIIFFAVSFILDNLIITQIALMKNPFFDLVFGWFTSIINVFVILILVTTLFLFEEKKREWIFPLWLSFIISASAAFVLKLIIARPRPTELLYPILNTLSYSFPSLHVMVAFAAVPILNKEFPKIKLFWLAFAVLVAFSRLYFNVHYLSDVVFGALLGYFIGIFIIYIEEKYRPFKFLK